MKVFVAGMYHVVGGSGGEALSAANLWHKNGLDVTWIPTWNSRIDPECEKIVRDAGHSIVFSDPRQLNLVEGIAGSPVVMFCNEEGAKHWQRFKDLGCKLIGVNCMTYWLPTYLQVQWDHVVCQSEYQMKMLKCSGAHLIRGAYDWGSVKFNPRTHVADKPFVIGRLAREQERKWNPDLLQIYGKVNNRQAILMGVPNRLRRSWIPIPEWCQILKAGEIPASELYSKLHCLLTSNDPRGGQKAKENWPRVGLEAMACGVPVVAENVAGWKEMITHGLNGLVYDEEQSAIEYANKLESNEEYRIYIAENARHHLETVLCNPVEIWEGWKKVFGL